MTYVISDDFTDPRGRWTITAPWDSTVNHQADKGFLATQEHVNVRTFRPLGLRALTMNDLDKLVQTQADVPQTQLESTTVGNNENWIASGPGLSGLTAGKLPTRGGWSGLQMTTTGAGILCSLTSSMTLAIDLSHEDKLSIVFPDYQTFDGLTSYVQLSSKADGTFSDANYVSTQVVFNGNLATMPELRLALSSFSSGAGAKFSLASVTGVQVVVARSVAPAAGLTFTMMAIRAVKNAWAVNAIDIDTTRGQVYVPPTLNGNAYGGAIAKIPFIRGDQTKSDPIPADGALAVYFDSGGGISGVSGGTFNIIELIFREEQNDGSGTGDWFSAQVQFNRTTTNFALIKNSYAGGVLTQTTIFTDTSSVLAAETSFVFSVEYRNTTAVLKLDQVDSAGALAATIYHSNSINDSRITYHNGRCGWSLTAQDRDVAIDLVGSTATGFAILRTQPYLSRTPIDGVRLSARYADDKNLFSSFTGPDLFLDTTKTISGNGSYRTQINLKTNQFIVDDWRHTYFELAVWVPLGVTLANQPRVVLDTPGGQIPLVMPTLQPVQWNALHFDLEIFRDQTTGVAYNFEIQSTSATLGFFWVDSMLIGRRRVSWKARAAANALFREFRGQVNEAHGGIHFTPEERGTLLQIEAEALTDDAWVAGFTAFPRYAQLGNPVYDIGFSTR